MTKGLITVVVPVFNEAKGIQRFLDGQLVPELSKLTCDTELIIVDDGSSDKTIEKIRACESIKKTKYRVIAFSRNYPGDD